MAGQTVEGEIVREIELKVDIRFANIHIQPKADEINDTNMPRNLHNAAELFLRAGMIEAAEAVRDCTCAMLDLYANNPDGCTGVAIGRACVCWRCGYCGLPEGSFSTKDDQGGGPEKGKGDDPNAAPGPCKACGEIDQINWLKVVTPDNNPLEQQQQQQQKKKKKKLTELPWIETPPLSKEELQKKKEAEMAAKRAEVEAKVKKALEERAKAEKES